MAHAKHCERMPEIRFVLEGSFSINCSSQPGEVDFLTNRSRERLPNECITFQQQPCFFILTTKHLILSHGMLKWFCVYYTGAKYSFICSESKKMANVSKIVCDFVLLTLLSQFTDFMALLYFCCSYTLFSSIYHYPVYCNFCLERLLFSKAHTPATIGLRYIWKFFSFQILF